MRTSEKEELLKDVLGDESYLAFREGLREELQRRVRRQRASRFQRRLLAVAACVPLALALSFLLSRSGRETSSPSSEPTFTAQRVRTVPLELSSIVVTRPSELVRVTPAAAKPVIVVTGNGELVVVRTVTQPLQLLSDEQLLAVFKGQAVVLARDATGRRQLVLPGETPSLLP